MAANASRAPKVREQRTAPDAIERQTPIVHSVTGALDDLGCFAERLEALLDANIANMHEYLVEASTMPEPLKSHAYSIWMIFQLGREKLGEIQDIITAITDRAYAEAADLKAVAA